MSEVILPISILIPYRKNETIELWVQTRESSDELNGLLEFPGGKVEKEETPTEACIREIKEEALTNVDESEIVLFKKYFNEVKDKKIMLMVFLFHDIDSRFENTGYKTLDNLQENTEQIPPANKEILLDLSEYFNNIREI